MKYFNNSTYYKDFDRIVATEKDVLGLIWLTKNKMMKYVIISVSIVVIFFLYFIIWTKTKKQKLLYKISIRLISFFGMLYLLVSIIVLLYFFFFNDKPKSFYSGYVIDSISGQPIKGVLVFENQVELMSNLRTDKRGFFKLPRLKNSINDLIFYKEDYKKDTVEVFSKPLELQSVKYLFLSDNIDTLKMIKIER